MVTDSGGISAHAHFQAAKSLPVVHGLCQLGHCDLDRDCQPCVLPREAWEPPQGCSRLPALCSGDLSQGLRILMPLLSHQFFPRAEVGHNGDEDDGGDGDGWDNMST